VLLFNAVAKAQRAQQEAAGSGARKANVKASREAFLAQLRQQQQQPTAAPLGSGKGGVLGLRGLQAGEQQQQQQQPGWQVLQSSFTGLTGERNTHSTACFLVIKGLHRLLISHRPANTGCFVSSQMAAALYQHGRPALIFCSCPALLE
jgi:hypothetical protein